MVACSSRRKTKHPFCSHDPKCYWNNKSCKKRPGANNNTRKIPMLFAIVFIKTLTLN